MTMMMLKTSISVYIGNRIPIHGIITLYIMRIIYIRSKDTRDRRMVGRLKTIKREKR